MKAKINCAGFAFPSVIRSYLDGERKSVAVKARARGGREMKAKINCAGFAFPSVGFSSGMTLRDYFAGQALAQLIKQEIREMRETKSRYDCFGDAESDEIPFHTSFIARESYAIADAMLAVRKEDAK